MKGVSQYEKEALKKKECTPRGMHSSLSSQVLLTTCIPASS